MRCGDPIEITFVSSFSFQDLLCSHALRGTGGDFARYFSRGINQMRLDNGLANRIEQLGHDCHDRWHDPKNKFRRSHFSVLRAYATGTVILIFSGLQRPQVGLPDVL